MSRRISNSALADLLFDRKRALSLPADLPYGLGDIACFCHCSERAIHLLITGRKRCPYIRSAMARFFDMPEAELIRRLFPAGDPFETKPTPGGTNHDAQRSSSRLKKTAMRNQSAP